MLVVPLPGHAHGHIGLLVKDLDERVMLLCGDAVWSVPSLRSGRFGFHRLISEDKLRQEGTYALLRDLLVRFPEWRIVPAHCPAAAQRNAGRLNS
jgi:glyoxylase-like metal-dependent hydrolase (beta-lactamase superfamily II)